MKYKVGDKVKVRSDLEVGRHYGGCGYVSDMLRLSGKAVTITDVRSGRYKIVKDGGDHWWTDEMLMELAEGGCIYAYELMKLAAENPEAYKDKKYKVAKGNCMNGHGNKPMAVCVSPNGVLTDEFDYEIFTTSETILEEIKPEPKPVPFMEAVKAFADGNAKAIYSIVYGRCRHIYADGQLLRDENGSAISLTEILYGQWFVEN